MDSTEETAKKLMETYEISSSLEDALGMEDHAQTGDFYV